MAGRPKIFDEEAALKKAVELFWTGGYEPTSTDTLIQTMGIQRGSFYHTFGSKKELFIRAIDYHEQRALAELGKLLAESEEPLHLLRQMFLDLADCPRESHLKGCFAGNTLAELAGQDEELADKAREHLRALEHLFYITITRAKAQGQLSATPDPVLLARYLLNLWNGINITRRVYPDKKSLHALIEWQLGIIK